MVVGGLRKNDGEGHRGNADLRPAHLTSLRGVSQLLSLVPTFKSDRGSAHSDSLHATSYTNWDSDQRKSCSSAGSSARQDTSKADHGEGTHGVIKGDRKQEDGW